MLNLSELFEKHADEYIRFERIAQPRHPRRDVCAFLMLDEIAPPEPNSRGGISVMISSATHDAFYLSTNVELLAERATEAQIVDLIRCGVRYSGEFDCLCMFA